MHLGRLHPSSLVAVAVGSRIETWCPWHRPPMSIKSLGEGASSSLGMGGAWHCCNEPSGKSIKYHTAGSCILNRKSDTPSDHVGQSWSVIESILFLAVSFSSLYSFTSAGRMHRTAGSVHLHYLSEGLCQCSVQVLAQTFERWRLTASSWNCDQLNQLLYKAQTC